MTGRTVFNFSIALAILAGGCAYQQLQIQDVPRRAELPQASMPETVLQDVKLNPGRRVQDVLGMVGRSKQIFNSLLKDHEGTGAKSSLASSTVGALKAKGFFKSSVLSDDSVVIYLEARGGFVQRDEVDGQKVAHNYTKLVAMFDPADGELLSYGLVP